jgi:hypothetical protein
MNDLGINEQNKHRVLFYLCSDCLLKISEPDSNVNNFFDITPVKFLIANPICCDCNGLICELDYTARLPMSAEALKKSFRTWYAKGYCYFSGGSDLIQIGI